MWVCQAGEPLPPEPLSCLDPNALIPSERHVYTQPKLDLQLKLDLTL